MKVTAFFNRRTPFYLLGKQDITDDLGFDAYPVEVDSITLAQVRAVRRLVVEMEKMFEEGAAPEESAQAEADKLQEACRLIFKTRAQING